MRTLWKIIGGLFLFLVLVLIVLRFTGFESGDHTPGLWLRGELVTTPVTDWSYTDKIQNLKIQTRTWYLIPHSVTTNFVACNGNIYVYSGYPAGVQYPNGRRWNQNVARDPHVRLKIGDQLFDRTLLLITDPAERAAALECQDKKYPQHKTDFTMYVFRAMPG